jgi:hypothetical protein
MATITVTAVSDPMDRRLVNFTTGRTDPLAWDFNSARSGGGVMLSGRPAVSWRYPADGAYTVRALAANGDSGTVALTIGPRQVDRVSPAGGPVAGGTVVQIIGRGFTGATGVLFGPSAGSAFTVNNDSMITVTAPSRPAGVVDVTVQHPAGNVVKGGAFTYS